MQRKKTIFVSGLPRSGSTLICQLLGHHPSIYSDCHSSPVLHSLHRVRNSFSNDDFLLSQMEAHYDVTYEKMLGAYRGFFDGWFANTEKEWVVDKNRAWLTTLDLAEAIAPDCYFIINIRELVQLFGSIESQHKKTVLLNSADGAADKTPGNRLKHYFNEGGLVSSCIYNIQSALLELHPDQSRRIKVVQFERLINSPNGVMNELYEWMGLPKFDIDPDNLTVCAGEADSFYRFKYIHKTYSQIRPPKQHWVAPIIVDDIVKMNEWFYRSFYPEVLERREQTQPPSAPPPPMSLN